MQFFYLIGKLYVVEECVCKVLQCCMWFCWCYSCVVLGEIKKLLDQYLQMMLLGGKLGQVLGYFGNQWFKLCCYVENVIWFICNNVCENLICLFVVGRKNWFFSDMVVGVKVSLNLYFLIEIVKVNDVDIY